MRSRAATGAPLLLGKQVVTTIVCYMVDKTAYDCIPYSMDAIMVIGLITILAVVAFYLSKDDEL